MTQNGILRFPPQPKDKLETLRDQLGGVSDILITVSSDGVIELDLGNSEELDYVEILGMLHIALNYITNVD